MCKNDKEKLYELLSDLAIEYIENSDINFEDVEKWEKDDIIISIDTLKDYLEDFI